VASVVTERNVTIAWVWNGAILYALQGCKLCNLYISAKFIGLGKAYGLRNGIVRWVSWNGEKALLLLAN
jgi:hypothetical protein